jgi:hypothetical protein
MKPELKYLLFTIVFYILWIIAAIVLNGVAPAGPCVPGITFLMIMALLPISIISLITTVILYFSWRKNHSWAIWCHLMVTLLFALAFSLSA